MNVEQPTADAVVTGCDIVEGAHQSTMQDAVIRDLIERLERLQAENGRLLQICVLNAETIRNMQQERSR